MNLETTLNTNDILKLYPDYDSVLGPYTRKIDGRKHIVLNNSKKHKGDKNKTKTISYPKALLEIYLNRHLTEDETGDHIDEDFTNNDTENLQILNRSENTKRSAIKRTYSSIHCQWCNKEFTPTRDQMSNINKPKFCSASCRGKYSMALYYGKIEPIHFTENVETIYYKDENNCKKIKNLR